MSLFDEISKKAHEIYSKHSNSGLGSSENQLSYFIFWHKITHKKCTPTHGTHIHAKKGAIIARILKWSFFLQAFRLRELENSVFHVPFAYT